MDPYLNDRTTYERLLPKATFLAKRLILMIDLALAGVLTPLEHP